jgi:hypothetical protein
MRIVVAAIAVLLAVPALGAARTHSLIFTEADLNGDGRVSAAEYAYYLAHLDTVAQPSLNTGGLAATGSSFGSGGSARAGGASASIHVGLKVTTQP